jgi:hypothetical protein
MLIAPDLRRGVPISRVLLVLGAALALGACAQTPSASEPQTPSDSSLDLSFDSQAIQSSLGWNNLQSQTTTSKHEKDLRSAFESTDFTLVALPLYKGISKGRTFWFVATEASNKEQAHHWGLNFSPKLALAKGTAAVQHARVSRGRLEVPGTVDFSPTLKVVPGPTAFPPSSFAAGAVGETDYSPLAELPNGTVINASHVANDTGVSDKVVLINYRARYVILKMSKGFYEDQGIKTIYYLSLDSSGDLAAALENVTFAPNLNAAPGLGSNDEKTSARSGIAIFTNGQTGASNANRQGLTSALLGEGGPLNVTESFPIAATGTPEPDYSPLWDAHVTAWSAKAVSDGTNTVQGDFAAISELGTAGTVTAPDGSAWGASGFIVNCPGISIDR